MSDGVLRVFLKDLIVDKNGRVVYYSHDHTLYKGKDDQTRTMADDPRVLDSLITDAQSVAPATFNGNKVIARLNVSLSDYTIYIEKHVVTYKKDQRRWGSIKQ